MSFGSYFAVLASLAVVLGVMGLALAALRRFQGLGGSNRALPMNVLQRVSLGPKHGLAAVQIGQRVVVMSMSEGTTQMVLELDAKARKAFVNAPTTRVIPSVSEESAFPAVPVFLKSLTAAMKRVPVMLPLILALVASAPLRAQTTDSSSVVTAPVAPTPAAKPVKKPAPLPEFDLRMGGKTQKDALRLSGPVGTVVMFGLLTLLPTLVLLMTSFTRILIVLHFLRQAIGTQTAPPSQLIAAFAILLTGFVMAPTLERANTSALQPWLNGKIAQSQMLDRGVVPFREFMLRQTRDRDIEVFIDMSGTAAPKSAADVSLPVLTAAFVTSELRTAFQIGFMLFLPFVIIDIVVAAVLMSMGMVMLPPAMISLPFKLLLFVLVDGWTLVVQTLVASFH